MSFRMEMGFPREADQAKKERWPVLIPVGTMEYHGPHCAYGCDTLVSKGIIEKIAEKKDCVIMPAIWYGVASYAVAGPEKNTIHVDCDTFERYIYCILKSMLHGGWRNIYLVISHQVEDYLPMTLACMKAAKKLTFEYLEETRGNGWWGVGGNADFYENLDEQDNPWNWIRVVYGLPDGARSQTGGDHAGKYECSMLHALYPEGVKIERLGESDEWFIRSAAEMSEELGEKMVSLSVDELIAKM